MKNLFLLFAFISLSAVAQTVNPELLTKNWRAFWVYVPNTDPNDYGVYHFRKVLSLEAKPATYVVHVSADNRYKLFVNGQLVSLGPARGDLYHWLPCGMMASTNLWRKSAHEQLLYCKVIAKPKVL